ncbi:MAG: family 20 glycosylhydrolase [Gammaproteobacteria bacterium]|nr:family 20 glycosylhydrolase [Gammaproteobacteria bacterium]
MRRAVARLPGRGLVVEFDVEDPQSPVPRLADSYEYQLSLGETARPGGRVRIRAASEWGALTALATLTQLVAKGEFQVSEIRDAPHYAWRGVMIDTVRHFISLDTLRRTIDVMAFYKLNVLHLHLTDDQGFRFRSSSYPELASVEAYSAAELGDLVDYAGDQAIRIVPEIDVPGHATSWLAAHPDWGVDGGSAVQGPSTRFGVHDVCLDIENAQVRRAVDTLLGELADVFPDEFVHFGGDEVGRDSTTFYQHVVDTLGGLGKRAIGWDECLHEGLRQDTVIQAWRGIEARDAALGAGHDCVVSAPYYLDLFYPTDVHFAFDPATATQADEQAIADHPRLAHVREGLAWMSGFGEYPDLPERPGGRVLGGEACLWSELVTDELLDVRLWSRMPAIAERFWNGSMSRVEDVYEAAAKTRSTLASLAILAPDDADLFRDYPDLAPLIEMLEPVKWYLRLLGVTEFQRRVSGLGSSGAERPYSTTTPLDRIVDRIPPESLATRRAAADLAASTSMSRWIAGWREQHKALERYPDLLSELCDVSDALVGVADYLDGQNVDIGTLGGPFGEYLLPIADVVANHKPRSGAAREILTAWDVASGEIQPIDAGHINDTYLVDDRYVLQRLNGSVFKDPQALMRNLAKAIAHEGGDLLLPPVPTIEESPYSVDTDGDIWRLFPHLPSRNFQSLPDELLACAGQAFGGFLATFADFGGELEEVIEGFHNLAFYLDRLDAAPAGDVGSLLAEINELRSRFRPGVARRVIHGDCKVNNLLFHPRRNEVAAIIDLDTLMLGDPAWDFGDLVRSAFAGSEETEAAAEFSRGRFEPLSEGFFSAFGAVDDVEHYAAAPAYMSFMLSVRFLTDHLEGDVYFKVGERGDNLARSRSQLDLARQFMAVEDQMASIIRNL